MYLHLKHVSVLQLSIRITFLKLVSEQSVGESLPFNAWGFQVAHHESQLQASLGIHVLHKHHGLVHIILSLIHIGGYILDLVHISEWLVDEEEEGICITSLP